jgi:hypothetical protein
MKNERATRDRPERNSQDRRFLNARYENENKKILEHDHERT